MSVCAAKICKKFERIKMKVLNLLLALFLGLFLTACADKYDPNKEYGFVMSGDERAQVVKNLLPN